jgi:2-keto-4-pentenoate hydratase/2-oxohepta-3-ene-1,7-dioic acid hydratase in catechol pathway
LAILFRPFGFIAGSIHFFLYFRNVAKELGAEIPGKPLVFLKPTTTYITEGQEIRVRILPFQSFDFERHLMNVIPETRHAHYFDIYIFIPNLNSSIASNKYI